MLGGTGTVRGFETGYEVGDTLWASSIELRVPLSSATRLGRVGCARSSMRATVAGDERGASDAPRAGRRRRRRLHAGVAAATRCGCRVRARQGLAPARVVGGAVLRESGAEVSSAISGAITLVVVRISSSDRRASAGRHSVARCRGARRATAGVGPTTQAGEALAQRDDDGKRRSVVAIPATASAARASRPTSANAVTPNRQHLDAACTRRTSPSRAAAA